MPAVLPFILFFNYPCPPLYPDTKGFSNNNEDVVNTHSLIKRLRFTTEKRNLLRELELLVIDEVSMVRCDILDEIDVVLRYARRRPYEKFGGVQVLFIGDMLQLPPVIKDQEWNILSSFYSIPYFFGSIVLQDDPPVYIEFQKIYRQSEENFIRLLNQVRNNELDEEGTKILDSRYHPSFTYSKEDGYIILTTHNEKAGSINAKELAGISNEPFAYTATIDGDFPYTAYPAEEMLQLKVGAQVMFIKNDPDKSKRYFNGRIGTVTLLEKDKILVHCKEDTDHIEVKRETWENIRYTFNKTNRQMEEEVIGSFTQYPLRLAWAITIHKSQGLTFEKAIIDAGQAFAPGQVYVALSRCTNLDGMVLKSRINPKSLFSDPRIVEFSKRNISSEQLQQEYVLAKRNHQQKILLSTFDLTAAIIPGKELQEYLSEHTTSFNKEALPWIEELLNKISNLQQVAVKFHSWAEVQFNEPLNPEENSTLIDRTKKAAEYFTSELGSLVSFLQQSPAVTDSKLHAKEFNETIKDIFAQLSLKKFLLQGFGGNLNTENWQKQKQNFILPFLNVNAYAGSSQQKTESPHPVLHQQLRQLRDKICSEKNLPVFIVAGRNTIDEMVRFLPQTLAELRKISGFGDAKIEKYGQQFLEIILEYCNENNLQSLIHEKSAKRERKKSTDEKKSKIDTKAESFRMYREGIAIAEIAKARSYTVQTIEGHLAFYVQKGELDIKELISTEKLTLAEKLLLDYKGGSIAGIKEKAGNNLSFGEIKLVIASLAFLAGKQK